MSAFVAQAHAEDPPKVKLRHRANGSIDIMLDDFVFVTVNYDYRYTSNGHRRWLAEKIALLIKP